MWIPPTAMLLYYPLLQWFSNLSTWRTTKLTRIRSWTWNFIRISSWNILLQNVTPGGLWIPIWEPLCYCFHYILWFKHGCIKDTMLWFDRRWLTLWSQLLTNNSWGRWLYAASQYHCPHSYVAASNASLTLNKTLDVWVASLLANNNNNTKNTIFNS